MKRIITVTAVAMALLLGALGLAAAASSGSSAKAVIQGCQDIEMNDSTPPFPLAVTWVGSEVAHHYGSYRFSAGCNMRLTAHLLGIGPDSNSRSAGIYLHIQRDDGTWYRTSTVHTTTAQPSVLVASLVPVNHRFYLHCADSEFRPQIDQPCRLTFRF